MNELRSRKQEGRESYEKLKDWSEAKSSKEKMVKATARGALTEVFRARINMKRAGREHEQFRREVVNGHGVYCRE